MPRSRTWGNARNAMCAGKKMKEYRDRLRINKILETKKGGR